MKEPRELPAQDVDFLLLAIKKATYGENLNIPTKCPHCEKDHEYSFPISPLLDAAKALKKNYSVEIDSLIINLKPYTYESATKAQIAAFEETKLFQSIMALDLNEQQRVGVFSNSFQKISSLNLEIICNTIESIVTPEMEVTNPEHIAEFVRNSSKTTIEKIQAELDSFKDTGIPKKLPVTCVACDKDFDLDVSFDPSHFFE